MRSTEARSTVGAATRQEQRSEDGRRSAGLRRAAAAIGVLVLLAGCKPAPLYTGAASGPRVALIGDSIFGNAKAAFLAHLEPWWQVGVRARNGQRIDQMQPDATTFATTLPGPDVVVIGLGTNDGTGGRTVAEAQAALEAMLASLPSASCVVLVNLAEFTANEAFNHWAAEWNGAALPAIAAADQRVRVVDWNGYLLDRYEAFQPEGQLTTDLVHLTPVGAEALAVHVSNAVARCDAAPPGATSGPPDAPTSVTGYYLSAGTVYLGWNPGTDHGSAITGYEVVVTRLPDSADPPGTSPEVVRTMAVSVPTNPLEIDGLENGRTYTFTVTASNDRGAGPASTASAPLLLSPPEPPPTTTTTTL